MCVIDPDLIDDLEPIHGEFGLTYAAYFVLRRSLMEAMPIEWQRRFAQVAREFWRTFDSANDLADPAFEVRLRGEDGRWMADPLRDYRHPNRALIESMRREPSAEEEELTNVLS